MRQVETKGAGRNLAPVTGGVEFESDFSVEKIALELTVASHLLQRLTSFPCRALGELERKLGQEECVQQLHVASISASSSRSRVYHTGAIKERVARALRVQDGLGGGKLHVRFEQDIVTLSIEHGEPLHRRGYRMYSGKAPMREDLARAIVIAARWNPDEEILLDPFCGSGTIGIEAALQFKHAAGKIYASDRDAGAVAGAQANAQRAVVAPEIEWSTQSFSEALAGAASMPASGGVILTNPPYGRRTQDDGGQLANLYRGLGNAFQSVIPPDWRLIVLCPPQLVTPQFMGLPKGKQLLRTKNGGQNVVLTEFRK